MRPSDERDTTEAEATAEENHAQLVAAENEKKAVLEAEAVRRAEIAAHPTNRLKKIAADLQAHKGDVSDRIAALNRAVLELLALLLADAPEAPTLDPVDEDFVEVENDNGRPEHAQRVEGQQPARRR